ncbi:hypothetical protein WKK05_09255 [Nostoc sp. UHCC 0302]
MKEGGELSDRSDHVPNVRTIIFYGARANSLRSCQIQTKSTP